MVDEADRLIVNTEDEARQLVSLHHADPDRIDVVHPGVDLDDVHPRRQARRAGGARHRSRRQLVAFVGRIQPLKAPDVLLRAAAKLPDVRVLVVGGPSGSGLADPDGLVRLADELGISDRVTFLPPQPREQLANVYRAADLVAVPSYSESFGLVAVEAQACGTPVVAAAVGGLPVAVRDGVSGVLVAGHDIDDWAAAIDGCVRARAGDHERRCRRARRHVLLGAHRRRAAGELRAGDHRLRARHPRRDVARDATAAGSRCGEAVRA